MVQPAEKRRATYADLVAAPRGKVAEIIDGELYVSPLLAPRPSYARSSLMVKLRGLFQHGQEGPGGWWILHGPELHFPHPEITGEIQAVVPDLAGWREERMPDLPETDYVPLAPDWLCEVLSPATEELDRGKKMPLYAHEGVRWAWLLDPSARTLEVYALGEGRRWGTPITYRGAACVHAAPFEAIEMDLPSLWWG